MSWLLGIGACRRCTEHQRTAASAHQICNELHGVIHELTAKLAKQSEDVQAAQEQKWIVDALKEELLVLANRLQRAEAECATLRIVPVLSSVAGARETAESLAPRTAQTERARASATSEAGSQTGPSDVAGPSDAGMRAAAARITELEGLASEAAAANAGLQRSVADLQGQLQASRADAAAAEQRAAGKVAAALSGVAAAEARAAAAEAACSASERRAAKLEGQVAQGGSELVEARRDAAAQAAAQKKANDMEYKIIKDKHTSRLDEVLELKEEIAVLKRDEQQMMVAYGEQHYAREMAEARAAKLQGAADGLAALTRRLEAVSAAKHNFELRSCSALEAIARREAALVAAAGGPGATGLPMSEELSSELARVLSVWPALYAASTAPVEGARTGTCGDESPTKHRASSQGLPAPAAAAGGKAAPVGLGSKPPRATALDARSVMSLHVSDGGSSTFSSEGGGTGGQGARAHLIIPATGRVTDSGTPTSALPV